MRCVINQAAIETIRKFNRYAFAVSSDVTQRITNLHRITKRTLNGGLTFCLVRIENSVGNNDEKSAAGLGIIWACLDGWEGVQKHPGAHAVCLEVEGPDSQIGESQNHLCRPSRDSAASVRTEQLVHRMQSANQCIHTGNACRGVKYKRRFQRQNLS
eukprot:scaffold69043_cov31-Prasinocladus_malaysianus.AAC.1